MHTRKRSLFAGVLVVFFAGVILVAQYQDTRAVPAFARKYNMTCTTCHAPFPKLKEYGDEFAGNGFVLKDKEAPRYFVDTGDRNLSLIRDLPLACRLEGFIKYHSETDREVDLSTPYNLKLLSGGSLTDNVAYYFYFFLSERGEVAGIEDAYIMFNNLFDTELDIYFGQFQICDPLFKRELRLTYEDYPIYKMRVGESGINLAYDRGIMLTYGFETGTNVMVEITNGNGIGEADDHQVFDNDKYKSYFGRVSQTINDNLRIGGFGYYGKEAGSPINEVKYFGPDLTVTGGPLELNIQYLERRDSDPMFAGDSNTSGEIKTRGAMGEVIYLPHGDRSKWYVAGLFNWIESDYEDLNYRTLTGHAGYVFRTNLRYFAEFTRDLEAEENRVVTGFVVAF